MSTTDTRARVFELVAEIKSCDPSSLTDDTRFLEDLEANSLDLVELISLAEGEFGVTLPLSRLPELKTLGEVVRAIDSLRIR